MKANTILDTIGNTPHVRINRLFEAGKEVWLKLERANPGGSIKDRIALAMVEEAERRGELRSGMVIIEPTSGNTGIGLAMVAAVKGYRLLLVMPESMSVERRRLMAVYGAHFELTPREKGMRGAVERAKELAEQLPDAWMPQQFDNAANPAIHASTTVKELLADFPEGFDALVTGVGTGGHISAVGAVLKAHFPRIKVYAVEPALSSVLSGGDAGPHPIQGIGAGFIPKNLDRDVLDGVVAVSKEEAFDFTRRAALAEGIFGGISSGATLAAIAQLLPTFPSGSRILGFNYDTGERYLSIDGLYAWDSPTK
jgi:cysteine synthase A